MILFEKHEWKLLWPFYAFQFVSGIFWVVMPFLVIYYQQRGLSFFEISILWAVMSLAKVLFEVPTGIVADVFGRKASAVSGYFLTNVFWIIIPFTRNFAELLVVIILISISLTLISGASDAWVYDWLKFKKQKYLIKEYYVKYSMFGISGMIIGPFIGGLLASRAKLDWLFVVEGIGGIIACLFLLFGKEHFKQEKVSVRRQLVKSFSKAKEGFVFIKSQKQIQYFFIAGTGIAGWLAIDELARQPFLNNLGMPVNYLGFFASIVGFFTVIAPFIGRCISRKFREKDIFIAAASGTFFLLLLILIAAYPNYLVGAVIILLLDFIFFVQRPLFYAHQQHFIPSNIRATVLSAGSMLQEILYFAIILSGGYLMDVFGPQKVLVMSSIFMIVAVLAFMQFRR